MIHTEQDETAQDTALARQSGPSRVFDPANWEDVHNMASAISESTIVPKEYRGSAPNCLIALEMADRLGISVLQVMQNMYVIHGRPSWSAQFVIACINSCGRFSPLEYRLFGEGDEWSCVAHAVRRVGRVRVDGPKVSIGMARREGWYAKSGSKWQTMPEQMLCYRAGSFFGKLHCPDVIMGMYAPDEAVSFDQPAPDADNLKVADPDFDAYKLAAAPYLEALKACEAKDIERHRTSIQALQRHHGVKVDDAAQDAYDKAKGEAGMDDSDDAE